MWFCGCFCGSAILELFVAMGFRNCLRGVWFWIVLEFFLLKCGFGAVNCNVALVLYVVVCF